MHKLIIEDDEGKTTVVPLIRDEITIGRKEGNTIRLTERNVSRKHAKLFRKETALFIEDLESYNGIKVNGSKVDGRIAVGEGDRIQIGDYMLGLKLDSAEAGEDRQRMEATTVDLDDAGLKALAAEDAPTQVAVRPGQNARLVCISTNFAGQEFVLDKAKSVIGRTSDNEVSIDHRSISRHHARIVNDKGRYTIVDLQSANGVRVNGEEYGKVELRRGDMIDLGHVRLRFVAPGESFAFDTSMIVDTAAVGAPKSGVWIVVALVVAAVIGVVAWQVMKSPPEPVPVANKPPPVPKAPPVSAADLNSAIVQEDWNKALSLCEKLDKKDTGIGRACKKAQLEYDAHELLSAAQRAATRNEHRQVLSLLRKIPKDSSYFGKARGELYTKAKKNYVAQTEQAVDEAIKDKDCQSAKDTVDDAKMVVPDLPDMSAKLKNCKEGGTAVEPPERPVVVRRPPKRPPRRRPPKRPPVRIKPVKKPAITAEDRKQAKEHLKQAWDAYSAGFYNKALSLAQKTLRVLPRDSKALAVVGASSCYLRSKRRAQQVYRKLPTKQRQLLRQICDRNGVKLD